MKTSLKKQQGMTLISMICIAIVAASIFFLAIAIFPIYMEHGKVTSALKSLKDNPEVKSESPDMVSNRLFKMLSINNFNTLTKENVSVNREDSGHTKIHIKYEVVKKIVSNASILVEFDDTAEIE